MEIKKVKFTITKTETMEIEVSVENGFDMPESMKEAIVMDDAIKTNPMCYIHNPKSWQMESTEVSDIEYE